MACCWRLNYVFVFYQILVLTICARRIGRRISRGKRASGNHATEFNLAKQNISFVRSARENSSRSSRLGNEKQEIIMETLIRFLNRQILKAPHSVIKGLIRSKVFNDALTTFLINSEFIEELVKKAGKGLLTEAFCGMPAEVFPKVFGHTFRRPISLHVRRVDCEWACQASMVQLSNKRKFYRDAIPGTIASGALDMPMLLKDASLRGLFLKELASSPGLHKGLELERLNEVFQHLRMEGVPYVGSLKQPFWVQLVKLEQNPNMTDRALLDFDPADKESAGIAAYLLEYTSDVIQQFVAETMTAFVDDILTRDVLSSPELVDLLNAVLGNFQITVKIMGPLSILGMHLLPIYGTKFAFLRSEADRSVCPSHGVMSSYQ